MKVLVPPQRMDFGQGKRRNIVGTISTITLCADMAGVDFSSIQ